MSSCDLKTNTKVLINPNQSLDLNFITLIYVSDCVKLYQRHSGLCQDNVGRKVCIEESKGAEKRCNKVKQYPQSNDRFVINSDD